MMAKFQVLEQAAQLQQTSEGGGLTRSSTTEIRGNEGSMRQRRRLAHLILQTLVVRRTSLRLCYLLPPIMRILPFSSIRQRGRQSTPTTTFALLCIRFGVQYHALRTH